MRSRSLRRVVLLNGSQHQLLTVNERVAEMIRQEVHASQVQFVDDLKVTGVLS